MRLRRRRILRGLVGLGVLGAAQGGRAQSPAGPAGLPAGAREAAAYDTLRGKVPLIRRTHRPPNYETPTRAFQDAFTPNEAFFVRYHLSNIPEVDGDPWRLEIRGDSVDTPVSLSLAQLRGEFETVELAALCLCSGNRRGLSDPHVPGVQWGNGAMGNALWKGVRLRDVLARAGVKTGALEVAFDGADSGIAGGPPDFIKSLPAWKALDPATLVAFEMNGEPLPHWHGYPARLVVPGWTATYWIKHLTAVEVRAQPLRGFWMNPGYRLPKGKFPVVDRFLSQETDATTPITEMVVNSLITNIRDQMLYRAGTPLFVRGVAWDGGHGIVQVQVSTDGGRLWAPAQLGPDLGQYAWRQWTFPFTPPPGDHTLMARAINRIGSTQTLELNFNPAGYHNNVVQPVTIRCA